LFGKIRSYVIALVNVEISIHVSLVRAVHSAQHAGPGLLKGKHAFNVVAVNLLARDGVDNDGLNAEEGERGATGLGRADSSQGGDDIGAGLSLPVCL
jgi:hypothetical protein